MLNQFIFQNYRIFQNETLLDFFPAPINEHKRSLLTAPGDQETFLPVIALYGSNGCGKSSVLEALWGLCRFMDKDCSLILSSSRSSCRLDPEAAKKPISFDLLFRNGSFLFRYQLQILKGDIKEEHMFYGKPGTEDAGVLFSRTGNDIHLGTAAGGLVLTGVPSAAPLLPILSGRSGTPCIQAAAGWFSQADFFRSNRTNDVPLLPEKEEKKDGCAVFYKIWILIYWTIPTEKNRAFLSPPSFSPTAVRAIPPLRCPMKKNLRGSESSSAFFHRFLKA